MSDPIEVLWSMPEKWRGLANDAMRRSGTWSGSDMADRIGYMADELDAALASLSAPKPEGKWVLVPREPTPGMLDAGFVADRDADTHKGHARWGAMLAAAPKPDAWSRIHETREYAAALAELDAQIAAGKPESAEAVAHCQMDWTPRGLHEHVWTCRHCGQQVTRNSADGHPHVPCTSPPRPEASDPPARKDGRAGLDRLWDSQWVNIVNAPEVLNAESAEDAVNTAVRMTEQMMAANFSKSTPQQASAPVGVECNCPGEGKTDPSLHAPNCPVRLAQQPAPAAPVGVEDIFEAFDEITGLCRHLRQGGPAPEDLHGLSGALDEAIGIAGDMLAALAQQPAPSAPVGVAVDVVREYLDARACYEAATRPPNSHAPAPTLKHGDPVALRLREARVALDKAIDLAPQSAPVAPVGVEALVARWRNKSERLRRHPDCDAVVRAMSDELAGCADELAQALAQQPAACDMGELCIGCEPRNPDGSCPDQQPAADPLVEWANSPLNFTATVGAFKDVVFKDGAQPAAVDEATRRDAERYRYLRRPEAWKENHISERGASAIFIGDGRRGEAKDGEALDAAIDRILAGQQQGGEA